MVRNGDSFSDFILPAETTLPVNSVRQSRVKKPAWQVQGNNFHLALIGRKFTKLSTHESLFSCKGVMMADTWPNIRTSRHNNYSSAKQSRTKIWIV
jgi:hypothetical protein